MYACLMLTRSTCADPISRYTRAMRYRNHLLRTARDSIRGRFYAITFCTQGRRPVLLDLQPARVMIRAIHHSSVEAHARTLAYVVMPDHVHWLIELTGDRPLERILGPLKSHCAKELNRTAGTSGRLWQRGYYEHQIRADEDLTRQARYIIENPVRAGLCDVIEEYPWWDAWWL